MAQGLRFPTLVCEVGQMGLFGQDSDSKGSSQVASAVMATICGALTVLLGCSGLGVCYLI